jgi:Amt family ammonium transporter
MSACTIPPLTIECLSTQVDAQQAQLVLQALSLDIFYCIWAGSLVFFMQAGFAMLEAGSVRSKNVKNVMLKNILDACGAAIGFFLFGYGIAYGGDDKNVKTFMGTTQFALIGGPKGMYHSWFFQFAFAATAATIVAGTVAERCSMLAYLVYSFVLTAFVYPIVVHTIWSPSGFLSAFNAMPFGGVGVVDFSGSGVSETQPNPFISLLPLSPLTLTLTLATLVYKVVHVTGGACALAAAVILGPRMGRFYDEEGNRLPTPAVMPCYSSSLQMLGTMILWFGWYG